MNNEQFEGSWQQVKGKFKEKWGKLTDDDLAESEGKAESLIGKITERYGIGKEEAEKKFSQFLKRFDDAGNEIESIADDVAEYVDEFNEKCADTLAYTKKVIRGNPITAASIFLAVGAVLGALISK